MDAPETPTIVAAGAVVCRKGPQVLLIHRPKYDDWSFPKGKLDPGEHAVTAAVREVAEETGLDVRLGPPLPDQEYTVGNGTRRPKVVHYWAGRLLGGDDVSGYRANAEVDEVAWVDLDVARRKLTYVHDRETLDAFTEVRQRSTPLVLLRHARATRRRTLDRRRPGAPAVAPGRAPVRPGRPAARGVRRAPDPQLQQPALLDHAGAVRRRDRRRPRRHRRPRGGGRPAAGRRGRRARPARLDDPHRAVHPPAGAAPRHGCAGAAATPIWSPPACSSCTTETARSWPPSSTTSDPPGPG